MSEMVYFVKVDELSIFIAEINETVIVIQNCEYRFIRFTNMNKQMQVSGKSLHIITKDDMSILSPLNFDEPKGL